MKKIRIGAGAGYSGDRIEPAVELAEKGEIQYLCFECLAERTIAIAQQAKMKNPDAGYDSMLVPRMEAVLPICKANGIKIITNMGAANPIAALKKTVEIASRLGCRGLKIAAITGDDVLEIILKNCADYEIEESGEKLSTIKDKLVSANAYLGIEPILEALKEGADVIITGRVADPSLFVAPMVHEFNWSTTDWPLLGQATVLGHLMECAGQVTGGYFADPGYKDVPALERLGFPIVEVREDGSGIITKVADAGGMVNLATCKEQLFYEIHDPQAYITPDVIADFTSVKLTQVGKDRVLVEGGNGRKRTDFLKVCIGYHDGYIGEGQISYAGPGAISRGRLAIDIVAKRLTITGVKYQEIRYDLIGLNALHGDELSTNSSPYEVRVRVAARTQTMGDAERIGNEVETLYTNGPAGGAGVFKHVREVIAMVSTLIPRTLVSHKITYEQV